MITKPVEPKLFLLDAYALIYRAYFAFSKNPRINSKGLNTSAIFGFTNTLLEVLHKEQPTHIAVVFDLEGPTQRHEAFEAYKANREEMPEDLRTSIPYIFKLIEGFRIPAISLKGFEADDVIGTLARQAEKRGFTTYMMTPDKDYGQLVDTNTFIYKPARMGNGAEVLNTEAICAKWQIRHVGELIDVLGLMGDAVDNIPGIPGVGEKTAIQLIKTYGSVEALLKNTSQLKGKLREKVEQHAELALQSKQLATIITDCPVAFNEAELIRKAPDAELLKPLFEMLEFKRLAELVLGQTDSKKTDEPLAAKGLKTQTIPDLFSDLQNDSVPPPAPSTRLQLHDINPKYKTLTSLQQWKGLIEELKSLNRFCLDTETTSLQVLDAELLGISISWHAHSAYYCAFPESFQDKQNWLMLLQPILHNPLLTLVGHNLKYDLHILQNYGIHVNAALEDTMVAHFLIAPEMRHNMDTLSENYLNYTPIPISALIGEHKQKSMRDVPLEALAQYAAEDADVTLQLQQSLFPELRKQNLNDLYQSVEAPLISVLKTMERNGILLDSPFLQQLSLQLNQDLQVLEQDMYQLAGTTFNISSPKQVGTLLFDHLRIAEAPKKTKTGQYATGEDVLLKLEQAHPIVSKILDFRELQKLKSTYVDALPLLVHSKTKRLHTTYNQVVAVTGRLSSDNPNLQNIPVRTARGRQIRKAFIAPEGHVLVSADYSQIELRIAASMSGDPSLCEAFVNNRDIHLATAAKVFGVSESEVSAEMRYKSKSVNFGILYGQGPFGLAENLKIPRSEAKALIDQYFKTYPRLKAYMAEQIAFAREHGYVSTLMGRRRWLSDILSTNATVRAFAERNAINAPIQGTAADMIKCAMIKIQNKLITQGFKSKLLLQVHDELVFEVPQHELEAVQQMIKTCMIEALPLNVPVDVGMGFGVNWFEAH